MCLPILRLFISDWNAYSLFSCQKTLPIPGTRTQMLPLWSYQSEVPLTSVILGYLAFTSLITFHNVYHYLSTCGFAFLSDTLIGLWGLYLIYFLFTNDMPHKKLYSVTQCSKTKHCEHNVLICISRCARSIQVNTLWNHLLFSMPETKLLI